MLRTSMKEPMILCDEVRLRMLFNLDADAESFKVQVQANVEYDVVIPAEVDWIAKTPFSKATVDGWTLEVLASLHADLAFLGSDGFKNAAGPTSMSYEEMNLKQLGVKCSDRTYVVADSSKILSEDRFSYARWEEVTGIVTAGKFTDRVREFLKDKTEVL